jgi:hypothetical protein
MTDALSAFTYSVARKSISSAARLSTPSLICGKEKARHTMMILKSSYPCVEAINCCCGAGHRYAWCAGTYVATTVLRADFSSRSSNSQSILTVLYHIGLASCCTLIEIV